MTAGQLSEIEIFIEDSGILFEKLGSTRMAGRIYGYMLTTDQEKVTFNELVEVLRASKSSISTNIKTLLQIGYLKMTTLPADRKTYYALNHEVNHVEIYANRANLIRSIVDQADKALNLRKNKTDKPSVWIKKTAAFYKWILIEMPQLLESYSEPKNL
ncbi:MAG: GbsR/MarR family transcriptional regulator [Bacteroidales bacterium]